MFGAIANYDRRMLLAQIVVQTNRHPYHVQVISLGLSLAPVVAVIALIVLVQIWRIRRNRSKSRHPVR